jgi:hypothetical protein
MRCSKNGSYVAGVLAILSWDELAMLKLRSRARGPPALLLLPRTPYFPYPSCPVPAAGPFRGAFSLVSITGSVFRLPKRPKRGLVAWLGLGVVPLEEDRRAGVIGGLKSGTMPRPDGAGVPSRGDGGIGPGDGFLDGMRVPWGRRLVWTCSGGGIALLRLSCCAKLKAGRLLWMTVTEAPSWLCKSGVPSLLGRTGRAGLAGDDSDGEVIKGRAGLGDALDGESKSPGLGLLNFCDDFRGGGLGGRGESRFFFFFSFALASPFTVELELEDVNDSLTTDKPLESTGDATTSISEMLPPFLRVTLETGGRFDAVDALPCRCRGVTAFTGR